MPIHSRLPISPAVVRNDAAYGYMRKHSLPAPLVASLAAQPQTAFANQAAWLAHLDRLGLTELDVTPDPVPNAALVPAIACSACIRLVRLGGRRATPQPMTPAGWAAHWDSAHFD
jgi:hypothetical protein